jgi:hypothetical protein
MIDWLTTDVAVDRWAWLLGIATIWYAFFQGLYVRNVWKRNLITYAVEKPKRPSKGDLWVNSVTGELFVYEDGWRLL